MLAAGIVEDQEFTGGNPILEEWKTARLVAANGDWPGKRVLEQLTNGSALG